MAKSNELGAVGYSALLGGAGQSNELKNYTPKLETCVEPRLVRFAIEPQNSQRRMERRTSAHDEFERKHRI
jgi:hypothetical protein